MAEPTQAYQRYPNPGPDPEPILWCSKKGIADSIFVHWKTSAVGVLLCVSTVAGVLSQQGITLDHAGTGTVVTLISALATALLGLLAKDN